MKYARLDDMKHGWFVGDFSPAALNAAQCEVAVKHYRTGDAEPLHHHRIATEVTVIVTGSVEMAGESWTAGDIIVLDPLESAEFRAVTDAITVVVKIPSVPGDKFLGAAGA